jgi:hypothetical protein
MLYSGNREKVKPVVKQGRKTTDFLETAGLHLEAEFPMSWWPGFFYFQLSGLGRFVKGNKIQHHCNLFH